MNMLIEFYKVHYNLGILAGFMLLAGIFFLQKGHYRTSGVFTLIFLVYNGFFYNKIKNNPDFVDDVNKSIKAIDIEDVWGDSKGNQANKKTQERLKAPE
jgi:hypothetical protein